MRTTLRGLARTPVFSVVAIFSLALGIGANTAIFSMLDQIMLRSLAVPNPQELVFLYDSGPVQGRYSSDEQGGPSFSHPLFRELQKRQTPFQGLAATYNTSASLSYQNSALDGEARLVSGNYFDLLGVRPAMGRLFGPDDDRTPGDHPVVVLSYDYWTSRFGGDTSVLNQKMIVNGNPMTIVGASQKGFKGEKQGQYPDVYVPVMMKKQMTPDWDGLQERKDYWLIMFGRLKPGVTRERAEAEINVPYRAQIAQDEKLLGHPSASLLTRFRAKKITLRPGQGGRGDVRKESKDPLALLMGITLLVLLLACANVANLQLARAAGRVRETAVRLALGASRARLVRQLLGESCLVALAGGALGLAIANPMLRFILSEIPSSSGGQGLFSARLDSRVLLFSLGISLASGVLFGLYPALQATKPDLAPTLKEEAGRAATGTGAANRFRKILVTAQIAISLLLLISAGLFTRSLVNVAHIDLGIRIERLLTFEISPKLNQYDDVHAAALSEQLLARLASIPGVKLATASDHPAIAGSYSGTNVTVEGYVPATDDEAEVNVASIGPDYFRTMGMPLVSGREIVASDSSSAPRVTVINEAFARRFFGGKNPLGRRVAAGSELSKDPMQIVGVVKDAKYGGMKDAARAVYYQAYRQTPRQAPLHFYVRTALAAEQVASSVRRVVAGLDPNLPVRDMKTMQAQIEENMFEERLMSQLSAMFAGLATLLAAVGLYGVLAYNVARRTREIGIRMALGAGVGQVRGLIVREVAVLLVIGIAVGAGAALATARFVGSILYGLNPRDPMVYLLATALLALVSIVAAYLPARKATGVDPMIALRYE